MAISLPSGSQSIFITAVIAFCTWAGNLIQEHLKFKREMSKKKEEKEDKDREKEEKERLETEEESRAAKIKEQQFQVDALAETKKMIEALRIESIRTSENYAETVRKQAEIYAREQRASDEAHNEEMRKILQDAVARGDKSVETLKLLQDAVAMLNEITKLNQQSLNIARGMQKE